MIGSIRWNLAAAVIGFAGTFLAAWQNNILTTAVLRSLYSGVTLFFIVFLTRWILGALIRSGTSEASGHSMESEAGHKGTQIDLTTPAADHDFGQDPNITGNETTWGTEDQVFTPLQPPKLASKPDIEPQELANALRRMSEE